MKRTLGFETGFAIRFATGFASLVPSFLAGQALAASTTIYQPLARCEGGSVVLDAVIENNETRGYQVAIHGKALALQVRSNVYGTFYDDNETLVVRTDSTRLLSKGTPVPSGYAITFLLGQGELQIQYRFPNIDGGRNSGSYVFRGCLDEK